MNTTVFVQSLSTRWKSTIIWSVCLGTLALLFAGMFEGFGGEIEGLADSFPEVIQGFIGDISAASTPAGWLGIELYSLVVPISLTIIAISFGAAAIGKEEDSGTLELLLSSPISRGAILRQKAYALMTNLGIVSGAVWLGVALGTLLFPFEVSLVDVFWASFMVWLMATVFGFAALAIQSLSGNRSFALGVGAGLVGATYFAVVVSRIVESFEFLQYLSPFYYYSGEAVLLEGLNANHLFVLSTTALVLYIIAHLSFSHRDTGV